MDVDSRRRSRIRAALARWTSWKLQRHTPERALGLGPDLHCHVARLRVCRPSDVFARLIVGWRATTSLTAGIALDALEQALHERTKPRRYIGASQRSRRARYTERLAEAGIEPSVTLTITLWHHHRPLQDRGDPSTRALAWS